MPPSDTTAQAETLTSGPSLRIERPTDAAARNRPAPPRSRPIGRRGYPLFVLALLVTLLVVITVSVSVGALSLPVGTVWGSVADHLLGRPIDPTDVQDRVVWTLRLPRVLLAVVVGAALSVAGTTLQACVRNPLADPYVLGVSQGAALGVVAVLVLGASFLGGIGLTGAAFLGAMVTTAIVYLLGRRRGYFSPARLVLAGVAVGYLCLSATSYLELRTDPSNLASVLFWLLGSVSGARWDQLGLPTAVLVLTMVWLIMQSRRLNTLLVGDESASALGVSVSRFRAQLLVASSLLTGTVVAVAGGIGFVGLMIPHIVRLLVGPDHRRVMLVAALLGGQYLALVDLAGRWLGAPAELPLGIFTAAIGAPFFLVLMARSRRVAGGA